MQSEYVHFYNREMACSSIEYAMRSIETDRPTSIFVPGPLGEITLPFNSAFLVSNDDWMKFLVVSDPHRKLFESRRFSGSLKRFSRWCFKHAYKNKEQTIIENSMDYCKTYQKLFDIHAPVEKDTVHEFLEPQKSDTVLEIGCSTGNVCHLLSRDVRKVIGVDSVGNYIKLAKRTAKKKKLRNCKFVQATYPCNIDEKIDYTVAFNVSMKGKEYSNHIFPGREALIVGVKPMIDEEFDKPSKLTKEIAGRFNNNYHITLSQKIPEDFGKYFGFDIIHMKRKT